MQSKSTTNRIWLRTVAGDEKILKESIFDWRGDTLTSLSEVLANVCESLDEPTPIVLKSHLQDLKRFNVTRFSARDFVEIVYFEKMILELVR